jgi:hypothetical protein
MQLAGLKTVGHWRGVVITSWLQGAVGYKADIQSQNKQTSCFN